MKRPAWARWVMTAVVIQTLGACAHSRLQLEVDVYRGDPLATLPLTPRQLGRIREELDDADRSIAADLIRQQDVAKRMFDIYDEYWCLHSRLRTPGTECDRTPLEELARLLDAHDLVLTARKMRVAALLDSARNSVSNYERLLATPALPQDSASPLSLQGARLRGQVALAADSVKAFARPPDTDYQASLAEQWEFLSQTLTENQAFAAAADSKSVKTLREEVQALAVQLSATAPSLAANLRKALESANGLGGLTASLKIIARQVNTLPEAASQSSAFASSLARAVVARELFDSQVDRLKDPADPVWRIVSAPENAYRWNQIFAKTWFYAEGKSDVVVVREGPLDFRVQSASNNPVALVASQLQISRAVTNATITVLRATVSPSAAQVGAFDPGATPETVDFAAAEDMARRNARLVEVERQRAHATRTTQIQLRAIAAQLSSGPTGGARTRLLQQLQGISEAYRDLLLSLRQESSDDSQEGAQD
jgi:hypothetical protein